MLRETETNVSGEMYSIELSHSIFVNKKCFLLCLKAFDSGQTEFLIFQSIDFSERKVETLRQH